MIAVLRFAGLFSFTGFLLASAFEGVSSAAQVASRAATASDFASSPLETASQAALTATDSFLFLPSETSASSPFLTAPDPIATSLSILTSLALVVGLIFLISWFLQRRQGFTGSACGRTLGILPIDGRRFVYIVDVMGRILVLGVTEHHISMLCEITDRAMIDSLRIQPGGAPTIPGLDKVFAFLKNSRLKTAPGEDESAESQNENGFADHTERAQQQIRKMEEMIIRRPSDDS